MKRLIPLLALAILLSACAVGLPASAPAPTQDPTLVLIAAEATVTAMAANQPSSAVATLVPATPTLAATLPTGDLSPTGPAAAPGEFWVTYLLKHRLAAMSGDGATNTFLTNTPSTDYRPTWSPDGQKLAFLRFDGSNLQDGVIHILPAGSDTPRQVDPANKYNSLAWLADNTTLVATRNLQGMYDVVLIDTDTGGVRQIASNVTEVPRISPDGEKILLLVNTGDSCSGKGCTFPNDYHMYDLKSGQTNRLTGDELPKMTMGWSPTGEFIAYTVVDNPDQKIQIITTAGQPAGSQVDAPWWINPWVFSPDGTQLAYVANLLGQNAAEVYVRPAGEGNARRVAQLDQSPDASPYIDTLRWRPDNSGLVFNSWIDVYTVNVDGSDLRKLPIQLENVYFDVRPSADKFTPAPEPTAPASWAICPGALATRLDRERTAMVSTNPPTPNNLRVGPTRDSDLVGQIQPGEQVEILSGPYCENGTIWWEVRSLSTNLKGWTLEGDTKTYWLEPVK